MNVLITGATSGLGEELAYAWKKRGASLYLTGRNKEVLSRLQQELGAETVVLALEKGVEPLVPWFSSVPFSLVINNAGFGLYGHFDRRTPQEIQEMLRVNCEAVSLLSHLAITQMLQEKRGGIVYNVSSAASFFPFPYGSLYGATKAFVTALSESLDAEYRSAGIRVLCGCPGVVATSFQERAAKGKEGTSSPLYTMNKERVVQQMMEQIEKKKQLAVIDWRYRLLSSLRPFLPKRLQESIVKLSLKKYL